jgi:branched-chain amino acid transport system ATP-binding protein
MERLMTDAPTLPRAGDQPSPKAPGERPMLEIRSVTLRFGGVQALTALTLDVFPGELVAVIGPNGAGKTSVFNCLNGVYHPQSGEMLLNGEDLTEMTPPQTVRAGVGRTFQNLALFVNLNVYDNLMLGRHHLMKTGALRGALWFGQARREEIEHRRRAPKSSSSSISVPTATSRWASCRTGSRSAWSWGGHSPWSRGCCCSTSRWPA